MKKKKIIVSACLLGKNCKYNGGNNYNEAIVEFLKDKEVIAVCPEVMGGLPTPRKPSEIVHDVVTNTEGVSVDNEFRQGAKVAMALIKDEEIECAILQSRSPSCGTKQIYDGTFSKRLIEGQGIFAEQLAKKEIKLIDSDEFANLQQQ
ncbi:DUF523 domain-containing protein [uncultured Eubacterium sp.]|uniref:DUF523 domain-containing protein n=1 Tax=Eubacterium sp. TaxID=142586 RepID=UPI002673C3A1|nr:DUF523 domain-containing protein [uncultured Eubacterium sp.]